MAASVATIFDLRPDQPAMRTFITGPTYHSAPNYYALYAAQSGGLVILQPRFDAEELLALVKEHNITHLHMVPTMFVRLLKLPYKVRNRHDLSSVAPCPPEVKRRMIEWWGPVINEYYGGTETGVTTALAKPGTVGRAMENCVVVIQDEDGKALSPEEIGKIFMRNHIFPDLPYENADAKRQEMERKGLFTCGDFGYLDEDGFLFIC